MKCHFQTVDQKGENFMSVRAIGFDFDQTLADTSRGIENCLGVVNSTFAKGLDQSLLRELSVSGLTLRETLSQIVNQTEIEQAVNVFLREYPVLGVRGSQLFEGVNELLQRLKLKNFKIYILSAKTHENLVLSLNHLQIEVDRAVGGLDVAGKTKYIKDLKLEFYVGDQISDMEAAAGANCKGVLVNSLSPREVEVPIHARFHNINHMFENIQFLLEV
jgi:phosphoglycolate phosphatase-like HAD superfamily hydrolase